MRKEVHSHDVDYVTGICRHHLHNVRRRSLGMDCHDDLRRKKWHAGGQAVANVSRGYSTSTKKTSTQPFHLPANVLLIMFAKLLVFPPLLYSRNLARSPKLGSPAAKEATRLVSPNKFALFRAASLACLAIARGSSDRAVRGDRLKEE